MEQISQKRTLGYLLKEARELLKFTLRDVENATDISNAYLSQLENDKIKSPSANYLYKLAHVYRLPFEELLNRAGVIESTITNHSSEKNTNNIALYSESLTDEEEKEMFKYLKFIRSK